MTLSWYHWLCTEPAYSVLNLLTLVATGTRCHRCSGHSYRKLLALAKELVQLEINMRPGAPASAQDYAAEALEDAMSRTSDTWSCEGCFGGTALLVPSTMALLRDSFPGFDVGRRYNQDCVTYSYDLYMWNSLNMHSTIQSVNPIFIVSYFIKFRPVYISLKTLWSEFLCFFKILL